MAHSDRKILFLEKIKKALGWELLPFPLLNKQREILLARARILCWVGFIIYPVTILPFNYFFYREKMWGGVIASIPASIAIMLLYFGLRAKFLKSFFQTYYHLPLFLILGVISNYAQTVNIQVVGGAGGYFFFPYMLIYIAFAVFYPGRFRWVLLTAISLIASYIFSEWWMGRPFGSIQVTSNIIYLIDAAFICIIGNRVLYRYFINDKEREIILENANKQLRALDQAKTRFFANLTHEFRTPLVANSTLLQAIEEEAPLTPSLKNLLDSAKISLGQILENVNDLLTQTRSDKGFLELRWSKIEIVELLNKSIEVLRPLAAQQGTEIVLRNDLKSRRGEVLQVLTVYGDCSKLKKVINNLLSNAIKFTRKGQIQISLSTDQEFLKIEVQDNGIGIPSEDLPHIFEPFTQASNNVLRDVRGTGLGLSIVRDFIMAHHGHIEVKSELGKGTSFKVALPLGDQHIDKTKLDYTEVIVEAPSSSERIVAFHADEDPKLKSYANQHPDAFNLAIIEDNSHVTQSLAYMLQGEYNLHFARDGEAGLELIRRVKPDLVLTDIMMPKMNGYELLAAIKKDPELKKIPVIFLTAKVDLESKIQGLTEGADEYLGKPFNMIEVRTRIKNLLSHKKLETEYIYDKLQAEFSYANLPPKPSSARS